MTTETLNAVQPYSEVRAAIAAKEAETERAINAEREKTRIAELAVAKAKQEKAEAESKAAREEQAKREAEAKRAANTKHRAKILFDALEGLTRYGVDEPSAKLAIEAIAAGKIPHVTIQF